MKNDKFPYSIVKPITCASNLISIMILPSRVMRGGRPINVIIVEATLAYGHGTSV